ncbi:MAG TPA: hypothetical protein VMT00_06750 [Thermoanaerobaculia bacterium]|nr:hypothetical protein [Thermoanaerobaculia bacterium]
MPEMHDHNTEVHHEESDVNVRAILWFVAIFIAVAIVVHLAVAWLFFQFRDRAQGRQGPPVTMVSDVEPPAPPSPRLQPFPQALPPFPGTTEESIVADTPTVDMIRLNQEQDTLLGSYGWVDREEGIVRIPIDEAIRQVAERGLPVRPQQPDSKGQTETLLPQTPEESPQ